MDRVTDPGVAERDPDLTVKQTGSGSGSEPCVEFEQIQYQHVGYILVITLWTASNGVFLLVDWANRIC